MDEIKFNGNIENEHEKNPAFSIFSEVAATATGPATASPSSSFTFSHPANHHNHQDFHIDADVDEDDDEERQLRLQESFYADNEELYLEYMRSCLAQKMGLFRELYGERDNTIKVLETVDYNGLIKYWRSGGFKKIVTMAGAGISTSAGIPDFRSPGTGLYDNLQSYNLPRPTAIFEIDYLLENPKPFYALAKDLYPGKCKPTTCHYFIKLLEEKGQLERHYTQNIDTLERIAGISNDKLVECHGTFHTNHCLKCRHEFSVEWMRVKIFDDVIPMCDMCGGLVKPDIVFFGESLPENFHILSYNDLAECDLLIIMGTSLEVQPFASLVERVNSKCVRLLINRDPVGKYSLQVHLTYNEPGNKRDIAILCDCDDGIMQLATDLGWDDDLHKLIERENDRIDMNAVSKNMKNLDIANVDCGACSSSSSSSSSSTVAADVHINSTQMINDDFLPPKL